MMRVAQNIPEYGLRCGTHRDNGHCCNVCIALKYDIRSEITTQEDKYISYSICFFDDWSRKTLKNESTTKNCLENISDVPR